MSGRVTSIGERGFFTMADIREYFFIHSRRCAMDLRTSSETLFMFAMTSASASFVFGDLRTAVETSRFGSLTRKRRSSRLPRKATRIRCDTDIEVSLTRTSFETSSSGLSAAGAGVFDGAGTVLSFVPIIVLFFVFMGILEDSGYLSRAAFLMDAFMSRLGLDGRAFVMQLMGFGCNVPALMGTRVMRSRGLRLLTMLMIPFSLCSARLQVFVFLTTAIFSPTIAPLVLFSLYVASFGAGFLTALLYRRGLRNTEPLLLELPPYRFPTGRQMLLRGWQETSHFLREAGPLIMLGVIMVWFLTHFPFDAVPASAETLAGRIAALFAPVFQPIGIDSLLTVALLFGFVAKEVVLGALAVIYGVGQDNLASVVANRIDGIQAYSFMLFVLIYTPCLSTVATLRAESGSNRYARVLPAMQLGTTTISVTDWDPAPGAVDFQYYDPDEADYFSLDDEIVPGTAQLTAAVPEPGSLGLVLGLLGAGAFVAVCRGRRERISHAAT